MQFKERVSKVEVAGFRALSRKERAVSLKQEGRLSAYVGQKAGEGMSRVM